MELVPKPVLVIMHTQTGSPGRYMLTQQPITQPCDLPLNYTITVLQRHLVTRMDASNPYKLAFVSFYCTELNSQWFCKEKKCLHLTAVTIRLPDMRGVFDS